MKTSSKHFRVKPNAKVRLAKWPTRVKPFYESREHYRELLDKHQAELSKRQSLLYAADSFALLLVFQAMDAAGKDGVIKHVMSGVNPQGTQVFSFKHPSAEELDHDFLWRTTRSLPERGRIGIFNRSYYEEVLVVRVHPELLHSERLPESLDEKDVWKQRYKSISQFEQHLCRNGTVIVKFFLHLSNEEQRKRFIARIDDPDKNWKFSSADLKEREFWPQYMEAYEACLSATSSKSAPWYIVPADDKHNARLIVSNIIVETLMDLKLQYPQVDPKKRKELREIRRTLARE
jgi:PPK2 family polyphosphate:nucleotide phosphotransferase